MPPTKIHMTWTTTAKWMVAAVISATLVVVAVVAAAAAIAESPTKKTEKKQTRHEEHENKENVRAIEAKAMDAVANQIPSKGLQANDVDAHVLATFTLPATKTKNPGLLAGVLNPLDEAKIDPNAFQVVEPVLPSLEKQEKQQEKALWNQRIIQQILQQNSSNEEDATLLPEEHLQAQAQVSELERRVREIAHRAWRDALCEQIQDNNYDAILAMLTQIRDDLVSLVPKNKKFGEEVQEKLDVNLVAQLLRSQAMDATYIAQLITYIIDKILQLESPARNQVTKDWLASTLPNLETSESWSALCQKLPDVFAFLFDKIEAIRLDLAHFHLQMAKPLIVKEGLNYQRNQFYESLRHGKQSLVQTALWYETCLAKQSEVEALANLHRSEILPRRQPNHPVFYTVSLGLIQLLFALMEESKQQPLTSNTSSTSSSSSSSSTSRCIFPETFELEKDELMRLSVMLFSILRATICFMRFRQVFHENLPEEAVRRLSEGFFQIFHARFSISVQIVGKDVYEEEEEEKKKKKIGDVNEHNQHNCDVFQVPVENAVKSDEQIEKELMQLLRRDSDVGKDWGTSKENLFHELFDQSMQLRNDPVYRMIHQRMFRSVLWAFLGLASKEEEKNAMQVSGSKTHDDICAVPVFPLGSGLEGYEKHGVYVVQHLKAMHARNWMRFQQIFESIHRSTIQKKPELDASVPRQHFT